MGPTLRRSNSSLITSSSRVVISILSQLVSRENGQRLEVSSTTTPRPSSSGSMKKINSELSPCSKDPTLDKFSQDLLMLPTRLNPRPNSPTTSASDTSQHAQPTWVLVSEPQFTSTSQN